MNVRIAPSILAADFGRLADEVADVIRGGADWIHIDVMDGQFVPNITMGPLVVEALRRRFDCHLDVHLMIESPERYIDMFADAGADSISVHVEATPHVHRVLQQIHHCKRLAGLVMNPGTPWNYVQELVDDVDYVLLMTVNPGFGGQAFLPSMLRKIERVRKWLDAEGKSDVFIQVDGGISETTIPAVVRAGATNCVAGSAVFSESDRAAAIARLRLAAQGPLQS